jgi:catechol 2,3-dioxygenase-like lactoylglutathione lyase family enzyme
MANCASAGTMQGMIVKRIVPNFAAADVSKARRFYADILGLEVAMDLGWIVTFASPALMAPQISVAMEGGSGTPVPDISVEVDDLDEVERRVREAGLLIEYGPAAEPWGVRRFYVRDPLGRLINILAHE